MRRIRQSMAAGLLALCLMVSLLPAPVRAAGTGGHRPNTTTYLPWGETDPHKAHTVHWAQGVTPPTMPGQLLADGSRVSAADADFKLVNSDKKAVTPETNTDESEYYVSRYIPGNGWYDLNKALGLNGVDDRNLCFALSAANMIHWWMDQNRSALEQYAGQAPANPGMADLSRFGETFLTDPASVLQNPFTSPVYDVIQRAYTVQNVGGFPDLVLDYFFNGYPVVHTKDRNTVDEFRPTAGGGLLNPVFGRSILSDRKMSGRYQVLNRDLKKYLDSGIAVAIGYEYMGPGSAHAITLWGAEYDENDMLCAIYVTDNNDAESEQYSHFTDDRGQSYLIGMIRYNAYCDELGRTRITDLKDPRGRGSSVIQHFMLTDAREGWQHYLEHGSPLYANGRPFLSPPTLSTGSPTCRHEYSYAAEGNRIVRTCENCSYRQQLELKLKPDVSNVYTGRKLELFGIYVSGNWTDVRNDWPVLVYEQVNAGRHTAVMKLHGVQAKAEYEILKAEQQAPPAPSLQSRTPDSVTLTAEAGMEYRLEGGSWQAGAVFAGLQPDTEYTFYARKAEDQNHNPSGASAPVRFRTAEGQLPQPQPQTVTLTLDDGMGGQTVLTGRAGETVKKPADPKREGFSFRGWEPELPAVFPGESSTHTAVWQVNSYTLTFDSAGGSRVAPVTLPYGAEITAPADPEREGFTFVKWSPDLPGTMPVGGGRYRAVWEKKEQPPAPVPPAPVPPATVPPAPVPPAPVPPAPVPPAPKPGGGAVPPAAGDEPVVEKNPDGSFTVTVPRGEETLITLPVKHAGPGTVAVKREEDGSRSVIRYSLATPQGLRVRLDGPAVLETADLGRSFADVSGRSWYRDAVAFVTARSLFAGTSETAFGPDLPMTRGMLAVVLHNLEGNPAPASAAPFTDVEEGLWYSEAVAWAGERSIVSGYDDGRFGVNDRVTREQLAVILYNFAGRPAVSGSLTAPDACRVSGWAEDAMLWAVSRGLIKGGDGGALEPSGPAARAQTAAILMNFVTDRLA